MKTTTQPRGGRPGVSLTSELRQLRALALVVAIAAVYLRLYQILAHALGH